MGLRGGSAARGGRGGPGAKDFIDPTPEFRYFRRNHNRTGATSERVNVWGMHQHLVLSSTTMASLQGAAAGTGGNRIYAMPEVFPKDGRIRRLGIFVPVAAVTPNAQNKVRIGIYSDKGPGDPYPLRLLYDSGELSVNLASVTMVVGATEPDIAVAGGSLLWAAFLPTQDAVDNNALPIMVDEAGFPPLLGCDEARAQFGASDTTPTIAFGWRHTQAFGELPTTFPSSAPVALVSRSSQATLLAIWFGFSDG